LDVGRAVLRAVDVVAFHDERVYDGPNDEGIIVDDEDSSRGTRRGNGRLISGHGACLDMLEEQGAGQLLRAMNSGTCRGSEIEVPLKLSVPTPKRGDQRMYREPIAALILVLGILGALALPGCAHTEPMRLGGDHEVEGRRVDGFG